MSSATAPDAKSARKPRLASIWLAGCSGCHMSFLDLDERLFDLARAVDLVFSPFVDIKEYPEDVDICLVEGAVANEDNLELIRKVRERTRFLVSFGDCAVTANVPAMRNSLSGPEIVLSRSYVDGKDLQAQMPDAKGIVPVLLDAVRPVHQLVHVDFYVPGCPPNADLIHYVVMELLAGRTPDMKGRLHFG